MRSRKSSYNTGFRINALIFTFFLVTSIFVVKLFYIQVIEHDKYRALAETQHWDLQTVAPKRGNILSSDNQILAGVQTHYLLFVEPKKVEDKESTVVKLTEALTDIFWRRYENLDEKPADEVTKEQIYTALKNKISSLVDMDLYWVVVERQLTPPEKEELESLNIPNIGFEEEPLRYYPEKTLASHVLGFVASNENGEEQGYFGIEGKFNGDLSGKPGRIVQEKDATGAPILLGGYTKVDSIDGRDIVLTVDRSVQYLVEKRLKEGVEKYDAVSGSVIVMDPISSQIIAMANFPTFDPGDFSQEESDDEAKRVSVERRNLAISEVYEPGSVTKPLTVSAAIDLGKVTPNSTFVDDGPVKYSDYYIDNWDGRHHGILTIVQLLQKSNNIGAAWVGHLIGSRNLYEYLRNFGLGERTGIELEGEDSGLVREYKAWTDIDLATASFGQGISATPLQVLNAFNVIANGGYLYQPRIVSAVIDEGKYIDIPPKKIRRVISEETSSTVANMLIQAVEGGESKYYNIQNYKIAGKTGTAQIPKDGKYDPNQTNATFVGFLANSRKFSMIVRIDRPHTSVYAAETAVPLWMQLADDLIKYYGIPPDY